MSKDKLTDYDATASNNTDVGGVSVAEGMLPSGVNNAIREQMSHQKEAFGLGTPLYVDQTNNRLGVGTVSPNQLLEVANSSGGATISISTDEAAGSIASKKYLNLDFAGYNNAVMARVQSWDESSSTGSGYLTFHTTPSAGGSLTERMRILSSGGITFNGDTAAANALDDYEEGTWVPAYSTSGGSFTYDSATQGQYTKIGNVVTVYFRIYTQSATVGTGDVTITGLPFAEAIPSGLGGGSISDCRLFAGDTPSEIGVNGSSIFIWYRTSSNGSNTYLQASDLGTGSVNNLIDGQITYITS